MLQGNPNFAPARFKGNGDALGAMVWTRQLPVTAGCIIGALPAGEQVAPYLRAVSLVAGTKSTVELGVGAVPLGILIPNSARMKNDPPVMQRGYFSGEPATLMRFGEFQIMKWAIGAGLQAPGLGGKVVANDVSGEIGFVDYDDAVPAGYTRLNATVVSVDEPNGATVFLGLGSLLLTVGSGVTVTETVAAPVASPAEGAVTAGTLVGLTSGTPGAQIYYTLDGAEPALATATLYEAPIDVDAAVTIKAVAVRKGMANSAVTTAVYTIAAA